MLHGDKDSLVVLSGHLSGKDRCCLTTEGQLLQQHSTLSRACCLQVKRLNYN